MNMAATFVRLQIHFPESCLEYLSNSAFIELAALLAKDPNVRLGTI